MCSSFLRNKNQGMEEKIFIDNSNGLKLSLIISYPDKNKQYPAILILGGFVGYKEEAHVKELAGALMQNGFAAIRFDCSGFGESDGIFEKDYLMSNYLKDIESVYRYVGQLKFVDKNKIGVVGYSLGGILSAVFAAEHPEVKICAVISSPTTVFAANWIKMFLKDWRKKVFKKEVLQKTKRMKVSLGFIKDAGKFKVLNFIQKVHCPLLVILGLADELIDSNDSRKIFRAANNPKKLIEIEGLGHEHKNYPKAIRKINKEVLAFLRKYL
jgi:hypothetical protein